MLENTETSKLTELSNGLKVASYHNGRPTSVIGVWVDSGSSYEPRETNGAAKFFHHLLAKVSACSLELCHTECCRERASATRSNWKRT